MTIHKRLNAASQGAFNLNQSQSGCCPDDGTTCRYSYSFDDDGITLVSVVVDGEVVALDVDATQDIPELLTAIEAKLKTAGYTSDQFVSLTAWRGADSLTIDIFSTAVFGNLVLNPAATITADANCVATPLCYYEIEVDVAVDVDFDLEFGRPGTVVGGNIAGDYSTGNETALHDDIVALFADEAYEGTLLQIDRVDVVENFERELYFVGIWLYRPSGGNLYIDGELIEPETCKPNYSQAE